MDRDESSPPSTPDRTPLGTAVERASRPRVRARMRTKTDVHDRRRRIAVSIALVVGAVFTINALVGDKGFLGGLKAKRQYDALVTSIEDFRKDNARMKEEADRLKHDSSALEEAARRQLGLIRPGETLVIVKDAKPAAAPVSGK